MRPEDQGWAHTADLDRGCLTSLMGRHHRELRRELRAGLQECVEWAALAELIDAAESGDHLLLAADLLPEILHAPQADKVP